jgi:hypothetical protein
MINMPYDEKLKAGLLVAIFRFPHKKAQQSFLCTLEKEFLIGSW